MIVSINQPAYLPWLGYFERVARSDLHIVLDHVQFEKNSFTNRNQLLSQGKPVWLTVPVKTKGRFGELEINSLEIDNTANWSKKHWRTIQDNYGKTPYFARYGPTFQTVYEQPWQRLIDLCETLTGHLLECFGITTPMHKSSDMSPRGEKDVLVLDLCRTANATTYLSGALGRDYLELSRFDAANITVEFQDYQHPVYPQRGKGPFVPAMGALDLLFNCGPDSLEILLGRTQN